MSEWQAVFICSMVVLLGILAYILYINSKLNRVEKK